MESTILRRRDVEFFREKNPFASHFFIDSAHFFQCFLIHPIFKHHKVKVPPFHHHDPNLTSPHPLHLGESSGTDASMASHVGNVQKRHGEKNSFQKKIKFLNKRSSIQRSSQREKERITQIVLGCQTEKRSFRLQLKRFFCRDAPGNMFTWMIEHVE